jgi:putative endonuclease
MAKTAKRQTGDTGEGVACKYLEQKGFRILERNYLRPWGEIDIVAQNAQGIRFVEVKSVTRETGEGSESPFAIGKKINTGFRPEDNVHPAKLKRLHRAIQTYLIDHKVSHETLWQIDVACVYLDFSTRRARVELLENVIL